MQSKHLEEMKLPKLVSDSDSEVAQTCLTLCDPVDCRPPGSPVHGISQARILEWVAISFSRGSSRPRDQTRVSLIAGRSLTLSQMHIKAYKGIWTWRLFIPSLCLSLGLGAAIFYLAVAREQRP